MLEDVFEDEEEMQASFREAVEQLVEASSGSDVGGGHTSFQAVAHQIIACHSFAQVTQGATAKEKLLAMLPATEQEVRIAELEESEAQKDQELALLRERLASFEAEAEA